MKWLHFILSHSIFISICAVALCYQSFVLLHIPADNFIYGFIFFSTLSSYNFYWLISKYSFSRPVTFIVFFKNNISYLLLFLLAGAGMLICLYFVLNIFPFVIAGIILTLIYSLPLWPFPSFKVLRKAGFLKTSLLAFTWAYVTTVIPAVPILDTDYKLVLVLLAARFFFMLLLCIMFDMRDMKMDKLHALHSLATDVSRNTLKNIMLVAFIFYMAAGFLIRYQLNNDYQLIAFFITGIVVWAVYRYSLKKPGYIFYYFVVDGLMLFTSGATYITTLIQP